MAAKKIKMKIEKKPVAIGHQGHGSGAGFTDNRPKRQRTRNAANRAALRDQGVK